MSDDNIIFGRNPVIELLKAHHSINKILIADGANDGSIKKITALAIDNKINVEFVSRHKLDRIAEHQNHQGVIALAAPVDYSTLDDIINGVDNPFLLLLDEIQDPHNFGALLRTAEAVGVNGVLIPKHRSVSLNATVAKTSAGAVEYVKVAQIGNVAHTIRQLKDDGFIIIGGDIDGQSIFNPIDLSDPIVLVIGSEGKGLRRLTKELCDHLISIPMVGKINSLNASAAGAVLMYEVLRQRIAQ
ncbi:MAG: 23S rRNA (guanosine(2251)-2'-O)-methyltransferase RlmB [Selenomonadaceae bacterium]|nr:23S rRNA (guanosine(2251)-2'-O)-methyltransferase RlmB [Selenomonadaceae bacterium]